LIGARADRVNLSSVLMQHSDLYISGSKGIKFSRYTNGNFGTFSITHIEASLVYISAAGSSAAARRRAPRPTDRAGGPPPQLSFSASSTIIPPGPRR
jgi:hypothetical protein